MDCEQVRREEVVERYLLGRLPEVEQEAFEQHYFECARCFEELQAYRALRTELGRVAPAIQAEPLRGRFAWRWSWAVGFAGVLVALGVGVWLRQLGPRVQPTARKTEAEIRPKAEVQQPGPSVPSLNELAQVQPPPYTPTILRGTTDKATERFRAAMQHYTKGDYRAAIPGLRQASELNPQAPANKFFLGICYLLTDQADASIRELRRTVALGDTPYLEEAHFYLAKALLRKGDSGRAEEELRETIRLQGRLEGEATRLLEQLQMLSKAAR